MGAFRNIIITGRCKLECSLNYLIKKDGLDPSFEKRILLDEIKIITILSTQVSITTNLIAECLSKKIKILFCDKTYNPVGEAVPYYNNYYSPSKISNQIKFDDISKDYLWKEIVKQKIIGQANNLLYLKFNDAYEQLIEFSNEVIDGDPNCREGHAAKVYFNRVFGDDFTRGKVCNINIFLNYGYHILLSTISRVIKHLGYLTEIGIHHRGASNYFNLSCDFIEPIRPLVDLMIIKNIVNEDNYKEEYVRMLEYKVVYNNRSLYLDVAIEEYVEGLFYFLKTGDVDKIKFIEYEL